jgi:NADPH:quinone reductase-like Zn-dependent oxidoreductase
MKPEDRITENIPLEMRALVLDGVGFEHLAVRKVPVPSPSEHQLLARV